MSNFSLLFAQQESRLNLVSSSGGRLSKDGNAMFYRPVYEHNGNTLSADSGYIYEDELKRQFFEAYSNVVITQPSGTVIYSDKLFYDASSQLAVLTNNVKMIDQTSTLTTNHLTYNMRTKYGTYSTGGRIVNQGDTITSQNAYYFEDTKDTYFRNKVVVRTPDVKIYTDTMRYNSDERITYFFGPTDIKGNKGENLYTEKGNYHTQNGIAKFSLNNLYTEGSRFLKSDSLYYEREGGVGKAYRNVVFVDTADKFFAYGGVGLYNQIDESITMTDKPLVISVVKDSVASQDPLDSIPSLPADSIAQDSLLISQENITDKELIKEPSSNLLDSISPKKMIERTDSIYLTADTLFSKMILLKDYQPISLNLSRDGGQLDTEDEIEYGDDEFSDNSIILEDSNLEEFSLEESQTKIEDKEEVISKTQNAIKQTPPKDDKEKELRYAKTDSTLLKKAFDEDKLLRDSAIMPEIGKSDSLINEALVSAQSQSILPVDSLKNETDTIKTRILKAYHNVRLFKSDLQAVADSVYYGEADSMFRFFGAPMIWAEGSQISADTIYMQVINNQLDNAFLKSNAFMVNAVLDTVKFNQLKGRKMTVF